MSRLHHEQLLNYTQLKYLNRLSCCCGSERVREGSPWSAHIRSTDGSTSSHLPVDDSLTVYDIRQSLLPLTF